MTIEPPGSRVREFRVRISRLIHERWKNGRRYNEFDRRPLVSLPENARLHPSVEALAWHRETVFERWRECGNLQSARTRRGPLHVSLT